MDKRIDAFLRRMPKGPEDWESDLSSLEDVYALRDRLILHWIPREDRRLMTPEDLLNKCEERLRTLSEDNSNEAEANFLKLVIIGASEVLIKDATIETLDIGFIAKINNALRPCLTYFESSHRVRNDKTLQEIRRAVRLGSQLLQKLELKLNSRIYELPLRVRFILSTWMHLKKSPLKDCSTSILEQLELARQPPGTWESTAISIPELVYHLLGERISRQSVYNHLGVIYDEYNVKMDDQLGELDLGPSGPKIL